MYTMHAVLWCVCMEGSEQISRVTCLSYQCDHDCRGRDPSDAAPCQGVPTATGGRKMLGKYAPLKSWEELTSGLTPLCCLWISHSQNCNQGILFLLPDLKYHTVAAGNLDAHTKLLYDLSSQCLVSILYRWNKTRLFSFKKH